MNKNMLVAEVDEDGQVVCVWLYSPSWKSARPIDHRTDMIRDLADYETFGAPRDEIKAWITKQAS